MPTFVIWTVWLVSAYAWMSEITYQVRGGNFKGLTIFVFLFPFLYLIYLSEGIEVAIADLNDKDADQLTDASLRKVLRDIKNRQSFFIANQQTLALCAVTLMTTMFSEGFPEFYIYPFGVYRNDLFVGLLNFTFVSILILCVCQVPAKNLAFRNSESFLRQSKGLWLVIRWIGRLNLSGPSKFIERSLLRLMDFPLRKLLPSRSSHYNASALIHGFCHDQVATHLIIKNDGSAHLTRYNLAIFLHGSRKVITGRMRAGEEDKRVVDKVHFVAAWKLEALEDLREHNKILDEIFADYVKNGSVELSTFGEHEIKTLDLVTNNRISSGPEPHDWTINFLEGLPESYCEGDDRSNESIVCVLYSVSGTATAGSFKTGNNNDYWTERTTAACRRLHFSVTADAAASFGIAIQSCNVGLEHTVAALTDEAKNCESSMKKSGVINYPIQSAIYKINWETMLRQ